MSTRSVLVVVLVLIANGLALAVWYRSSSGDGDDLCESGDTGCQAAVDAPARFPVAPPSPTSPATPAPTTRPNAPTPTHAPTPATTAPEAPSRDDALAAHPARTRHPKPVTYPRPTPAVRYATTYLSDRPFTVVENGWGPVERDTSNGERKAGDGHRITIRGAGYGKGLGVHGDSDVLVSLAGRCTRFAAVIGVDDEAHPDEDGDGTRVVFRLLGDGRELYRSPELWRYSAAVGVSIDISRVQVLDLVVDDLGYRYGDHADWASARVTCRAG